mgnify:CR=1 FL=1
MPNIPQITAPVSNNKSYSFTNRQYDGNIEPFDMVELAQPIKSATAQDNDSAAAMMMGRKNLAPLTVQIKDPTMAVEEPIKRGSARADDDKRLHRAVRRYG